MTTPPKELARALRSLAFNQLDLAKWAGVSLRTMVYWLGGKKFPNKEHCIRLSEGLRRRAARMLVTARILEDTVGVQSGEPMPSIVIDSQPLPGGYTKKDAERYQQIVGRLPDWRKSQLSDYQLFTKYWRERGLEMEEIGRLWVERINESSTEQDSTDQERSVPSQISTV